MSTEDALAIVENLHGQEQADKPQEQEVNAAVEPERSPDSNKTVEPTAVSPSNTATDNTSTMSKSDYAFAKEKSKRKALKKHYEEQIRVLKQQLKDRQDAKPAKDNIQDQVDARVEELDLKKSIEDFEDRTRELGEQDVTDENERRISNAFSTPKEQDEYRDLLRCNGSMFLEALNKHDPDHVVLDYLDGLHDYPRLLKVLMTDVDALKSVFVHRDMTGRLLALETLNRKLHTETRKLPRLGRLVRHTTSGSSGKKDTSYWNDWLKQHPKGR